MKSKRTKRTKAEFLAEYRATINTPTTVGNVTTITTRSGKSFQIDKQLYWLIQNYTWSFCFTGQASYVITNVSDPTTKSGFRTEYLHRLIVDHCIHTFPELGLSIDGKMIDHINGDTSDNRLCNLRVVNRSQSTYNTRQHKLGKQRYYYDNHLVRKNPKTQSPWTVQIRQNGKKKLIRCSNEVDARLIADIEYLKRVYPYADPHVLNHPESYDQYCDILNVIPVRNTDAIQGLLDNLGLRV